MNSKSASYVSKKMQYAELRDELNKLDQNMKKVEENMKITIEHLPSIRKLGTLHSSLFMSARSILTENQAADASHQ